MRGEDRLSSLPDELIHRILSFLELKMVITTSILSSRWRFLWTSVPTLLLYGDQEDSATSISLSLINYTSPKINKFLAQFDEEDVTDHHIALWIRFAVNRSVEDLELCLIFNNTRYDDGPYHNVLGCLLNCRSLKILRLWGCNLKSSPLSLPLLTILELERVNISDLDTSGCPALESITLNNCNKYGHINLYAPNPSLGYLKVEDVHRWGSMLTIHAPNVQSIRFEWNLRENYIIKDLSSLRSASLLLDIEDIRREDMKSVVGLLSVLHAPTLKLNHDCVLDPLDTCDFDGLRKSLLLSAIHSLKTIRVNFRGSRLGLPCGEPKPYLSVDEFLKKWEEEFQMLELLLNSCMVLEKMTIIIEREYRTKKSRPLKWELLLALQNRVLAVPKASSIAEICFS